MKIPVLAMLITLLAAAGAVAGDWTETIKLSGDFRYRHEQFDVEGKQLRNRQRIRSRLDLIATPEQNLLFGVRLTSGGDDPVSSNQTLGDGFVSKGIMLDRAYFTWTESNSGARFTGGKMGNPFYLPAKSELIWDSDISLEGITTKYVHGECATQVFVHAGGLWVEERKAAENAGLFGGQIGVAQQFDGFRVVVGGGYLNYTDLVGPLYDGDFFGNTSMDSVSFDHDFNLVEFFGAVEFEAGGTPVTVFADVVTNQEADDHERAYMYGAKLGKTKAPGSWEIKYNYREVQADAVMGALTDSDFRGGGTDAKGHEFGLGYQLSRKAKFATTFFVNEVGLDSPTDFKRLMVDLKFKF